MNFLFSLLNGVIILKQSKHCYRLISLRKRLLRIPLLILDIPSVESYWEIFFDQSYEKYNKVKLGDVVFDIGANVGMFSIKAAMAAGDNGKIFAFEPEPINFLILKENTKSFRNISIIPKALGNNKGEIEFLLRSTSGAHFIAHGLNLNPWDKTIMVQIDLIDNLVKNLNLKIIDFVKIDVEGWEEEVLRGARNSLKIIKFFAIGSYHNIYQKDEITAFLENENFKVVNDRDKTYAWNREFFDKI